MTHARHVLFAAHPTVGHTSALRAIGAELRTRGHATSFAIVQVRVPLASRWPEPVRAASNLPAAIAADGAEVRALRSRTT
jgi:UDP:flavonoid glycosyltransferase YjiC (YdhE family)